LLTNTLHQSPGPEYLEIAGSRLPTFEQVLLCYIVTMRKKRAEDSTNKNELSIEVSKIAAAKVIAHYEKGELNIEISRLWLRRYCSFMENITI